MTAPIVVVRMSKEEAKTLIQEIREGIELMTEVAGAIRERAEKLRDQEGWRALGYKTWDACVQKEFEQSVRHVRRQLSAAAIEREITDGKSSDTIEEGKLRPLAALPAGERKEVWEEAQAEAGGKTPSGPQVKTAVEKKQAETNGKHETKGSANGKPKAASTRPEPPPGLVETEVEGEEIDFNEGKAEDSLSDDEWLDLCPARNHMTAVCREAFDREAIAYRRTAPARAAYRAAAAPHTARISRGRQGPWAFRHNSYLSIEHPKDWVDCPECKNDKDLSCGRDPLIGICPKCRGAAYHVI